MGVFGFSETAEASTNHNPTDLKNHTITHIEKTSGHEIDLANHVMPSGEKVTVSLDPKTLPKLELGAKGSWVRFLQSELRQEGINVSVDGDFGSKTKASVIEFQKREKLNPDGVVGKATWTALLELGNNTPTTSKPTKVVTPDKPAFLAPEKLPITLRPGNKGPEVKLLQEALISHGFQIKADSDFGPMTQKAVERFQELHQLQKDGVVGPATWRKLLGNEFASSRISSPPDQSSSLQQEQYRDWRDLALKVSGGDEAFQAAMCFVRKWEGGYTVDHAGATNYGVTKPFYDEWLRLKGMDPSKAKSISELTETDAIEIYFDKIWIKANCAAIADVAGSRSKHGQPQPNKPDPSKNPIPIAICTANGSINYGPRRASQFLAQAISASGGPDPSLSGASTGELTRSLKKLCDQCKAPEITSEYLGIERNHYRSLCDSNPSKYERFRNGWFNRNDDMRACVSGPQNNYGIPVRLLGTRPA